ncbi:MAG: transglutaminase, partial [Natronospirillum sp.]
KYMSLRVLGIPNDRLRMIYVNARLSTGSQAHMVLGYYESPTAQPLILDNIRSDIVLAGQRPDLIPVFSFNSQGLWVGAARSSVADPTSRLSRWRNVLARMQTEGFLL